MVFTQELLDQLDEMIASGVLSSRYGDKELKFDNIDGLIKRRAIIASALCRSRKPKAYSITSGKGIYPSGCGNDSRWTSENNCGC